jgi:peroxiredoxin
MMASSFEPANLVGRALPAIELPATNGQSVALGRFKTPRTVIYCYPRTSVPGQPAPTDWDVIPGARGCTPQACTFRDHHAEITARQAGLYGLSTQTTAYQQEMANRLHLPFPVLSDADFRLTEALGLPTFEVDGMRLLKRLTLIVRGSVVETAFYPVSKPVQSAEVVLRWLDANPL